MATTYPTTKQTFTDPNGTSLLTSPDHAGLHTDINDTVEAMQDTVGTTAGTNVLKNFAAGDFPARINSSNVLQQVVTGTVNTTVGTLSGAVIGTPSISAGTWSNAQLIGTAQITGGSATSQTLVTPKVEIGSDATGDIFYNSGSGVVSRLAVGAIAQHLLSTGTLPAWGATMKIGSFTRDTTAASGTVAYTGVGFKPTSILFLAIIDGTNAMSVGIDDATTSAGIFYNVTTFGESGLKAIFLAVSGGNNQNAKISSFDSDGFSLDWTKNGTPTGTGSIYYLAMR